MALEDNSVYGFQAEARGWALVAQGRFMSRSEDAVEAARKALDLFRSLRHRAGEAKTLVDLAKGQLASQETTTKPTSHIILSIYKLSI